MGIFAQNVAAVEDTGWEMDGISAPNAAIKSRQQRGTVLHKTHMPLAKWFLVSYLIC